MSDITHLLPVEAYCSSYGTYIKQNFDRLRASQLCAAHIFVPVLYDLAANQWASMHPWQRCTVLNCAKFIFVGRNSRHGFQETQGGSCMWSRQDFYAGFRCQKKSHCNRWNSAFDGQQLLNYSDFEQCALVVTVTNQRDWAIFLLAMTHQYYRYRHMVLVVE